LKCTLDKMVSLLIKRHLYIGDADKEKRKNMVKDNELVIDITGANIEETIKNNPAQDFNVKISELDRTKKYLVYCRTGRRSGLAVKVMKGLGFKEVYDVAKGINQWKAEGLPIVIN
jgi:rhodanese-related sulfurtransferase